MTNQQDYREEESLGPVFNPDGTPTAVTLAFLRDTGRTVEDLLPKQDPLCTDECISADVEDGTITQHHPLCPVLASLTYFHGMPFCGHGVAYAGHATEAERAACEADYDKSMAEMERLRLEMDERRHARLIAMTEHPTRKWGETLPVEECTNGEPGYFCRPCWEDGDLYGFHPYSAPPCDPSKGRGSRIRPS